MKFGYARVSTSDQDASLQRDALKAAGCEKIIVDQVSGAAKKRPKFDCPSSEFFGMPRLFCNGGSGSVSV